MTRITPLKRERARVSGLNKTTRLKAGCGSYFTAALGGQSRVVVLLSNGDSRNGGIRDSAKQFGLTTSAFPA